MTSYLTEKLRTGTKPEILLEEIADAPMRKVSRMFREVYTLGSF
jgi:hypothetical protein